MIGSLLISLPSALRPAFDSSALPEALPLIVLGTGLLIVFIVVSSLRSTSCAWARAWA